MIKTACSKFASQKPAFFPENTRNLSRPSRKTGEKLGSRASPQAALVLADVLNHSFLPRKKAGIFRPGPTSHPVAPRSGRPPLVLQSYLGGSLTDSKGARSAREWPCASRFDLTHWHLSTCTKTSPPDKMGQSPLKCNGSGGQIGCARRLWWFAQANRGQTGASRGLHERAIARPVSALCGGSGERGRRSRPWKNSPGCVIAEKR